MPAFNNRPTAAATDTLAALMQARSKHADYQLLHPSLATLLGDRGQPAGRHELQRQRFMSRHCPLHGLRVLDIGANTGYFSFAALAEGASVVVSQEGNADHAGFIALAARHLPGGERLSVRNEYHDFGPQHTEPFDLTLCLNVLHHLGDDFGDPRLALPEAKAAMLKALNQLARTSHQLWLQLGFNWKGDRHRPLFEHGTKAELVDFVRLGTQGHWQIEQIAVVDPQGRDYVPLDERNAARFDALGEFLNRPLFRMRSLHC
jgi:hypothetical protein